MNGRSAGAEERGKRILWLDILRGLAILMVFLFHFTVRYPVKFPLFAYPNPAKISLPFGWLGVFLFFMISGFIIYMTIQKKKGPVHFLTARLARLVPPYWAAITLILALSLLYRRAMQVVIPANVPTVLANLVMIPDVLNYPFLDGTFWSLYVELKFYVIFALIWKFIDLRSHRIFLGSFVVVVVITFIHNYVRRIPLGLDLGYFPIFWSGMAAYKVLRENLNPWIYVGIVAVTTVSTYGYYRDGIELLVGVPVFALLFVVIEPLFFAYPKIGIVLAPLSKLGRVSYSYYLVHQSVGYLVLGLLAAAAFDVHVGLLAAITACLMISVLGFHYVEQLDKPIGKAVYAAYLRLAERKGIALR